MEMGGWRRADPIKDEFLDDKKEGADLNWKKWF